MIVEQELAATALRGADRAHFAAAVGLAEVQTLEDADGGVDGGVGGVREPAVPTAVLHRAREQVVGEGVEPI